MAFKKSLVIGQASLEYFILFGLIATIVFLGFGSFLPQIRNTLIYGTPLVDGTVKPSFFQRAAQRMTDDTQGMGNNPGGGGTGTGEVICGDGICDPAETYSCQIDCFADGIIK